MPKVTLVTDNSGNIIGTFQAGPPSKGAPTHVRLRPLEGQQIHEVDVPDKLVGPTVVQNLHATHRIDLEGGSARLVENNG